MNETVKVKNLREKIVNVPRELRALKQWVCWKLEPDGKGKLTKKPKIPGSFENGDPKNASTNKPQTWVSFEKAIAEYNKHKQAYDGIGFVFSKDDPYCGIDIDHCVVDGIIEAWGCEILNTLQSYSEFSQSGSGVHVIVRASLPGDGTHTLIPGTDHHLGIFDRTRFFVFTGNAVSGYPFTIESRQDEVRKLYFTLKPPVINRPSKKPIEKNFAKQNMTNAQIFEVIGRSKQAEKFNRLWAGDLADYPSQSEADLALCSILAFYTKDFQQIVSIIQDSKLWDEKWERADYQERTIGKALESVTEVFRGKGRPEPEKVKPGEEDNQRIKNKYIGYYENAKTLEQKHIAPLKWIINGYISEGFNMLCGKQKMGKSFFALNAALAVSTGGVYMDEKVDQGRVLSLFLDDSERRIKERISTMVQGGGFPESLDYRFSHDRGIEGLKLIDYWLSDHKDAKLVIIDTLAKFRDLPSDRSRLSMYDLDVNALEPIRLLSHKHRVSILLVHHLRKTGSNDIYDLISGSVGLSAEADLILILKRDRTKADAVLYVSCKDAEDKEVAISFDNKLLYWRLLGKADDYRMSTERQEIINLLTKSGEPLSPKDISMMLKKDNRSIRYLIYRMSLDGIVKLHSRGKYIISTNNANDANNANITNNANDVLRLF